MFTSITNPEKEAPEEPVAIETREDLENMPSETGGFDPDLVREMERLTGLRREELFRGIAPKTANTILGPRTAISPEREFEIRQELIETMEGVAETAQKRDQITLEAWYKLKVQAMKSASQVEAAGVSARGRTEAAQISGLYRQAAVDSQALERSYNTLRNNTSQDTINGANAAVSTLTSGQGSRRGAALLRNARQKQNFVQEAVRFMSSDQGQNDLQRQAYLLRVSNNTGVPITDLVAAIKTSPIASARTNRTQILGPDGNRLDGLMSANVPLGNISTLQDSIDRNVAEAARRSAGSRGGNAVAVGLLNAVGSPVPGEVPLDSLQTLGVTAEMIQDPAAAQTMEDAAQQKINDLFDDLADAVERTPYIQGQIDSIMATAGIQGTPFREYLIQNGLNPDSPADLEAGFELLEDEYADVREYESGQAKLRAQVARERQKAELRRRKEYEAAMGPERIAAQQVVQGIDLEELPEGEEGAAPPQRVGMGLREDQMNNMRVIEDRLRAAAAQAEEAGDERRARYLRREADRYLQLQLDVTDVQMGRTNLPDPMTIDAAQRAADESAGPETYGASGTERGIEAREGTGVPKKVGDSEYYVLPNQGGELFRLQDGRFVKVPPPAERRPDDFATDFEDIEVESDAPEATTQPAAAVAAPAMREDVEAEVGALEAAGATAVSEKIPGDDYSPYATFDDGSYGYVSPTTGQLVRVRPGATGFDEIAAAVTGTPVEAESAVTGGLSEEEDREAREARNREREERGTGSGPGPLPVSYIEDSDPPSDMAQANTAGLQNSANALMAEMDRQDEDNILSDNEGDYGYMNVDDDGDD